MRCRRIAISEKHNSRIWNAIGGQKEQNWGRAQTWNPLLDCRGKKHRYESYRRDITTENRSYNT